MASATLNESVHLGNSALLDPVSTLDFNGVPVPLYEHEGQTWIAGPDLGRCLGYKNPSGAVLNIFNRHKDELDPLSTHLILRGVGGKTRTQRTYNEQGAYIVAMFATTDGAKDVRLWLAQLPRRMREFLSSKAPAPAAPAPSPSRLTTAKERNALAGLVNRYVGTLPGGPHQEAYKAAWRKVHDVMGIKAIEELTVEQLPRAVMFMQTLVDAKPAHVAAETPKALPPASVPRSRGNALADYEALYGGLPESTQYWDDFSMETLYAHDEFKKRLEAIKQKALRPFKENRKFGVRTSFDENMSSTYSLFEIADQQLHTAYCCYYEALQGLRGHYMLLRKG